VLSYGWLTCTSEGVALFCFASQGKRRILFNMKREWIFKAVLGKKMAATFYFRVTDGL